MNIMMLYKKLSDSYDTLLKENLALKANEANVALKENAALRAQLEELQDKYDVLIKEFHHLLEVHGEEDKNFFKNLED